MNVESNSYTFVYASVMVIVVAAVLSFTATELQPLQETNVRNEKMQNILASIGMKTDRDQAKQMFDKYITEQFVIDDKGDTKEGVDAFNIDLKQEIRNDISQRNLPVYIGKLDDGTILTIVPVRGKGLWGPIWGYISFEQDYNTIYGAVFDHKTETPGLGAEIKQEWFQAPFKGKKIFEGDDFVSINVHKGGHGAAAMAGDLTHGVDAISGGTITSKGVQAMLKDCISGYVTYFKNNQK